MELLIKRQTPLFASSPLREAITPAVEALLRQENASPNVEISLLLCDDATIQGLNARHRGFDKPTDVLSFAQGDPELLGDIVISLETAARQAEAAGWPLTSESALLAVHGTLHLLGYDDETVSGAEQMQTKTRAALTAAGIMLPAGDHPFFAEYESSP